jgi:large subunit ribosomal protein L11
LPNFSLSKKNLNNMATKKVKVILKLNLPAGEANPAPPVGPALGQHGVNIMEFCKKYNEKTKEKKGQIIPAEVTIYEDRTFTFVTKLPPASELIKKALNLKSGAKTTGSEIVGTITRAQLEAIAKEKMQDLNTINLESAIKTLAGTARSMGIKVSN